MRRIWFPVSSRILCITMLLLSLPPQHFDKGLQEETGTKEEKKREKEREREFCHEAKMPTAVVTLGGGWQRCAAAERSTGRCSSR